MPMQKRDPHSGALIFVREPHEIKEAQQRDEVLRLRSELDELKALVQRTIPAHPEVVE